MSLPGLKMINFFQNLELCKMLIVLMQLVQLVISGFHECFYIKWKAIRTKLKWLLKKWDSVWKLSFAMGQLYVWQVQIAQGFMLVLLFVLALLTSSLEILMQVKRSWFLVFFFLISKENFIQRHNNESPKYTWSI